MEDVNQHLEAGGKLYLYGDYLHSDPIVFYHGAAIQTIVGSPQALAAKLGRGKDYIIMAKRTWVEIQMHDQSLPQPLLTATSTGPEGDLPLVLVRAENPENKEKPSEPLASDTKIKEIVE